MVGSDFMLIKVNEKNLIKVVEALNEAIKHANYNELCFSSSDIARARAVSSDVFRALDILVDESINILPLIKDNLNTYEKIINLKELDKMFAGIETPEAFEIHIVSHSIWRVIGDLRNEICIPGEMVCKTNRHYEKYWLNTIDYPYYNVALDMKSILEYSKIDLSFKKAYPIIQNEFSEYSLESIETLGVGDNDAEIKIKFVHKSDTFEAFVFKNWKVGYIVFSKNSYPYKVVPFGGNKSVDILTREDQDIYNCLVDRYKMFSDMVNKRFKKARIFKNGFTDEESMARDSESYNEFLVNVHCYIDFEEEPDFKMLSEEEFKDFKSKLSEEEKIREEIENELFRDDFLAEYNRVRTRYESGIKSWKEFSLSTFNHIVDYFNDVA